jgi:hypothetical protein
VFVIGSLPVDGNRFDDVLGVSRWGRGREDDVEDLKAGITT